MEQPHFQVIAQAFNQMGVACNTASTKVAKFGHLPELCTIFYRFTKLLKTTTTVMVVYDGDKHHYWALKTILHVYLVDN